MPRRLEKLERYKPVGRLPRFQTREEYETFGRPANISLSDFKQWLNQMINPYSARDYTPVDTNALIDEVNEVIKRKFYRSPEELAKLRAFRSGLITRGAENIPGRSFQNAPRSEYSGQVPRTALNNFLARLMMAR